MSNAGMYGLHNQQSVPDNLRHSYENKGVEMARYTIKR